MKKADLILPALLSSSLALCFCVTGQSRAADSMLLAANATTLATPEELSEQEVIRRKEQLIRGEKMIADADAALKAGKSQEAAELYTKALTILPKGPISAKDTDLANAGLIKANLNQANAAIKAKNYDDARKHADEVLKLDANNKSAKEVIHRADKATTVVVKHNDSHPAASAHASAPTPTPVDEQPEFLKGQHEVTQLMRDARLAFQSNQLDLAAEKLNLVMTIDKYNEEARVLLRQVADERQRLGEIDKNRVRSERAADIAEAWAPPVKSTLALPTESENKVVVVSKEKDEIDRKLDTIKLPKIEFKDATIGDVVNFLSEQSREIDQKQGGGNGVNIVLHSSISGGAGAGDAAAPAAPAPATPAPAADAAAPAAAPAAAAPAPAPSTGGGPTITLNLRDVPLRDALRYVTDIAGLKFRVEARAVIIVPANWVDTRSFVTKSFKIQAGVFASVLTNTGGSGPIGAPAGGAPAGGPAPAPAPTAAPAGGGSPVSGEEVKKFFTDAGVPFPPGASITYNDRINTLFVTNTPEHLETFEQVLSSLNIIPTQVTIEAKFVEIKQTDLKELGFDWILGDLRFGGSSKIFNLNGGSNYQFTDAVTASNPSGLLPSNASDAATSTSSTNPLTNRVSSGNRFAGDGGTLTGNALDTLLNGKTATGQAVPDRIAALSGLLTDPQFQVVLRALDQHMNTDLLCAPKVTTISGQQAKVEVIREFIYPTEFEPPRVASASTGGGGTTTVSVPVISPPTPGGFQTRNLGVTLNVTPQVGADGYTISLTMIPEVSDFDGFVDYGSRQNLNDAGNSAQIGLAFPFPQPIFSSRRVTTSVTVWDGQTVVLGGLIREDTIKIKDKTPFLGDIPLIGRLFRNELENNVKKNLMVFVTARLVNPAGEPVHKFATSMTGTTVPTPASNGAAPAAVPVK